MKYQRDKGLERQIVERNVTGSGEHTEISKNRFGQSFKLQCSGQNVVQVKGDGTTPSAITVSLLWI
jgi:hypothetical protein